MAFVVLIECIIITRLLLSKLVDKKVYGATILTNVISGVTGIIISMILNGGWYLVVWFPWVSSNEINLSTSGALEGLIYYYAAAFILTLIIETIANVLLLRNIQSIRKKSLRQ